MSLYLVKHPGKHPGLAAISRIGNMVFMGNLVTPFNMGRTTCVQLLVGGMTCEDIERILGKAFCGEGHAIFLLTGEYLLNPLANVLDRFLWTRHCI